MRGYALQFAAPYRVSVTEESLASPAPHEVLVKTLVSAISPGTELLIYRGEWPENLPVDENIPALAGKFRFPLKYGYAAVGTIIETGADVPREWLHRRVFAFHPHQSHFLASPEQLIVLPDSLPPEAAALLPNMETAVSFLMDGKPMIGERVVVFGQGVVGLLTTRLLSGIPLAALITVDRFPVRRDKSREWGATASADPAESPPSGHLTELLDLQAAGGGADLVYELSGNPAALDLAIAVTGFSGRIIVGSWYGAKRSDLNLGGSFHRGHVHMVSSQVSRLAPELTGRWTKGRRLQWALRMLEASRPADLITHRFHLSQAAQAYALLHEHPEHAIQVMLTYEDLS
jgi:2-desacetyl-2-hydroxyethyl bacteriochlorophyllide A dehydrogenase